MLFETKHGLEYFWDYPHMVLSMMPLPGFELPTYLHDMIFFLLLLARNILYTV